MFPDDVVVDLPFIAGSIMLVGVVIYAVTGGADFGGGIWDLLATGKRAKEQRLEIARAIGPIWEANHVWLIFVIVLSFTLFPPVFAAVSTALYIPLTLVLAGITLRGAAFIFRAYAHDVWIAQRNWGAVFAVSSVLTPVLFGMCAGAVATGRIRVNDGDVTTEGLATWLNPFSILIGLLALTTCAYLAAVYLCVETTGELREDFRRRALGTAVAFGVLGTISLPVARSEAPVIWDGLWNREAWTVIPAAVILGLVTLGAVWKRSFRLARVSAVGGVAMVLGGWALAQYPYLVVPDLTLENTAASDAMLRASLIIYAAGAVILMPSLALLFAMFKGRNPAMTGEFGASTGELPPSERDAPVTG